MTKFSNRQQQLRKAFLKNYHIPKATCESANLVRAIMAELGECAKNTTDIGKVNKGVKYLFT